MVSNKRWFAVIAHDRCNDERRLVRWVLCASTQNEELHETLLRLHFKTLFRWKVQNRESLYADFLFHSLLSFVVSPCNFLLILHLLCVPGRIDTYKNSFWMQRGYVLASKQSHASVICYLLVAFAWVHFVTNFHVCFSQNGNYERVQNFLARTSRNAVRETDLNLTVNAKQITFNSIGAPMYTEFSWSLKSQCFQFKVRTFRLNLDRPHISIQLFFFACTV